MNQFDSELEKVAENDFQYANRELVMARNNYYGS